MKEMRWAFKHEAGRHRSLVALHTVIVLSGTRIHAMTSNTKTLLGFHMTCQPADDRVDGDVRWAKVGMQISLLFMPHDRDLQVADRPIHMGPCCAMITSSSIHGREYLEMTPIAFSSAEMLPVDPSDLYRPSPRLGVSIDHVSRTDEHVLAGIV
ncbi:hypothetical protein MRB53_042136 [Persea americana]|nr:hypothetical protein MRB53_042136 [Persea americana]